MQLEVVVIGVISIWLLLVTIYLYNIYRAINALSKEASDENFISVLNKVLKREVKNTKKIKDLQKSLDDANLRAVDHLQKVGLVRYNPFDELGGDHSFALALLNDSDNGFIITGLHTRERTRVYVKDVVNGKTKNQASKEELKALKKAIND